MDLPPAPGDPVPLPEGPPRQGFFRTQIVEIRSRIISGLLFMLPMMIGMGAMSFVYIGRSSGIGTVVFGGLFVLVIVGMLVMSLSGGRMAKKAQINDERRDYLRYLAGLRDTVRQAASWQRGAMLDTEH